LVAGTAGIMQRPRRPTGGTDLHTMPLAFRCGRYF
jgi:hypothetical protein